MDIATLGLEVRSESLLRAAANLDKFAGTTQRVEQRVAGFSTGMTKMQGSVNRLSDSMQSAGQVLNGFNNVLQVLGLGVAANEMKNYADSWTRMGNKIAAASQASGLQARSLEKLRAGADDARAGMEEYVDLYARIMRNAKGVVKSEEDVAKATNIVSKAFAVGGAAASEQAAGVLQLGQALGSGVLQGDELRSIRENAPVLAQAIADEFGTTIAGLKDLGAEGKLTSDRILQAILKAQGSIEAQFNKTSLTIEQGLTLVKNSAIQYIGTMDGITGVSKTVTGGLQSIAKNFEYVGNGMLAFGGIAAAKVFGPMIANQATALKSTLSLNAAMLSGNAIMLNGRTAALQKATYIRQAAVADEVAARAALTAANAERTRALATVEAIKTGQLAGVSRAQASVNLVNASRAVSAAQLDLKSKTDIAKAALLNQDVAMVRASKTARVLGAAMSFASKGLAFVGGPVGAGILAIGTAMYFSSQKAEEARQKSDELHKAWNNMGLSAVATAENIDQIAEAIAKMGKGGQFRFIQDTKKELDRLLLSTTDDNRRLKIPLFGDTQGDELYAQLKSFKKTGSSEDNSAYKEVAEIVKMVQKFPSLAGQASESLDRLLQKNISGDAALSIIKIQESLNKVQQGVDGLSFNGFNLGAKKADEEFTRIMDKWGNQLAPAVKEKLYDLEKQLQAGGISAQQFKEQVSETLPTQGYGALKDSIYQVGDAFDAAKNQAEKAEQVLNRIDGKSVDIAINITGLGLVDSAVKQIEATEKTISENYKNALDEASKTPAQKRQEAIKAKLLNGADIKNYSSPELDKMATEIDRREQLAKKSDKSSQRDANAYRDLIKSGQDRAAQLELEAQVAGKAGVAADVMRMKLELEQRATDKGRTITPAYRIEIDKLVASYQNAAEAAAKATLQADLYNERQMMGLSTIEQAVASRMQNAGLDYGSDPQMEAAIRYNEQLKIGMGLANSFFSTIKSSAMSGRNAIESISDAFINLGNQLIDMALQNMVANAFGPLLNGGGTASRSGGSGILGGLFSFLGFADGGAFGASSRMFAKGGTFTNSIFNSPTAFKFADGGGFSNGIMGEAGPEAVMPLKRDARGALGVAVNGWGAGKSNNNQTTSNQITVKVEASKFFDARVEEISGDTMEKGLKEYDRSLPDTLGQKISMAQRKNRSGF